MVCIDSVVFSGCKPGQCAAKQGAANAVGEEIGRLLSGGLLDAVQRRDRAEQQDRQNHLPENQTKRMMTGLHRHFGKWYRPAPQDAEKQQHHDQKRSAHVRNSDIDAHAFWLNIRT